MRPQTIALLLLSCAGACNAQPFDLDSVPHFAYTDEVTMAGSALRWTLQLPAKSERSTYFATLAIYCETACEVTQLLNGTTATGTEVSAVALNLAQAATAKFYKNSDSTGGTAFKPITIPAGGTQPIDVKVVLRRGSDAVQNFSLSVLGSSGKARAYLISAEKTR